MDGVELKEAIEAINRTHEAFKTVADERGEEVKKFGDALGLTTGKLEKLQDQLDLLETKIKRTAQGDIKTEDEEKQDAYREAYSVWYRKGDKGLSAEQAQLLATETKNLASDDNTTGGYWMPVNHMDMLIKKLIEFSPIREIATVITLARGNSISWPKEGTTDFACDWVGERQSRPETVAGTLKLEEIPTHGLYANPFLTQQLLDDVPMIMQWITERVGTCFAVKEGEAHVKGDGVGKPFGFTTNAEVIADAFETADAGTFSADDVIKTFYQLRGPYAANGSWVMERLTIRDIRLLKDGNGQYLWQTGLQAAAPSLLLGRPIMEAIDMPTTTASGDIPMVFGDFRAGYWIVDRQGVNVLRDPFSNKPFIEFYTVKRTGGQVVLAEALQAMKYK